MEEQNFLAPLDWREKIRLEAVTPFTIAEHLPTTPHFYRHEYEPVPNEEEVPNLKMLADLGIAVDEAARIEYVGYAQEHAGRPVIRYWVVKPKSGIGAICYVRRSYLRISLMSEKEKED